MADIPEEIRRNLARALHEGDEDAAEEITEQALDAGWDMLVVDEAHRLTWTDGVASVEYQVVEALARTTPAALLLTATPEQLGMEGHFARLRLLDPSLHLAQGHFRSCYCTSVTHGRRKPQ